MTAELEPEVHWSIRLRSILSMRKFNFLNGFNLNACLRHRYDDGKYFLAAGEISANDSS